MQNTITQLPESQIAILTYDNPPIYITHIDSVDVAKNQIKKENDLFRIDLSPGTHEVVIHYKWKSMHGIGITKNFEAKAGHRYKVTYWANEYFNNWWIADIREINP